MTKAEIVSLISKRTGVKTNEVMTIVESFMSTIQENMAKGENIYLRGFGTFAVKKRAEKVARNITKNTSITIPEHYTPTFKAASSFKDKIKKSVK